MEIRTDNYKNTYNHILVSVVAFLGKNVKNVLIPGILKENRENGDTACGLVTQRGIVLLFIFS